MMYERLFTKVWGDGGGWVRHFAPETCYTFAGLQKGSQKTRLDE